MTSSKAKSRSVGCIAIWTRFFVIAVGLPAATVANAQLVTECSTTGFCHCIRQDLKATLDFNVEVLRKMIAGHRAAGKAIGYLSVPISNAGGGYFGVNIDLSKKVKTEIETRLGAQSVWILNPGEPEAGVEPAARQLKDLAALKASGSEYMYMWTRVLASPGGLGEDFDIFYFVGPSDFGRQMGLTGNGDMSAIDDYFEKRLATDPGFKAAVDSGQVTKAGFRNYYALRASTAFSLGAHDEWNIARVLNERRRGTVKFGVPGQLSVFFDGRSVPLNSFEAPVAPGYAGRCNN